MRKAWLVLLIIVALSTVSAQEDPFITFSSFECNDAGELYFQAGYDWDFYKGGYVYLDSVNVNTFVEGKSMPVEGWWFKFKTMDFVMSELKLNSPTAHFFSKKGSLKEGSYTIEISYAVSKNGIERFKKQSTGSVICPKQVEKKVVVKEEPLPEKEVEEPKEVVEVPVDEPPFFDKNSKDYTVYYVVGLLVVISMVSGLLVKKLPRKGHKKERKVSPDKISKMFEKK